MNHRVIPEVRGGVDNPPNRTQATTRSRSRSNAAFTCARMLIVQMRAVCNVSEADALANTTHVLRLLSLQRYLTRGEKRFAYESERCVDCRPARPAPKEQRLIPAAFHRSTYRPLSRW